MACRQQDLPSEAVCDDVSIAASNIALFIFLPTLYIRNDVMLRLNARQLYEHFAWLGAHMVNLSNM